MKSTLRFPHTLQPQGGDNGPHGSRPEDWVRDVKGAPMTRNDTGVSGTGLLLLGGLLALALNQNARRSLVGGTRTLLDSAQETLDDTVKPALASVAHQTQHAAQVAAHRGAATLETLREEVPSRTHALLENAQEAAGSVVGKVADKAADLTREVRGAVRETQEMAEDRRREAQKALKQVQRQAKHDLGKARQAGSKLEAKLQDRLAHQRHELEEKLARARRHAEKELRRSRRHWNPDKLERAVEKQVASLKKQTERELARLDRQTQMRLKRAQSEPEAGRGGLVTLLLLGAGAVVLARVPAARQAVLNAVGKVSPEAANWLHRVGCSARNLVGSMWLERMEEPAPPAPAPAKGTQAGTAGATWGASTEPGAPATSGSNAGNTNTAAQVQPNQNAGQNTQVSPQDSANKTH